MWRQSTRHAICHENSRECAEYTGVLLQTLIDGGKALKQERSISEVADKLISG